MRIAVVGGGPGGLLFATLIRGTEPSVQVTVFERNRADDTFGFGVVFSDRTLAGIDEATPVLREALAGHGRHWDDIEIRLKGERIRCGGNGMAAIARKTLLALLQDSARASGAELRFSTEMTLDALGEYDLVVAADGTGSKIREHLDRQGHGDLGVEVETATAKFIWFGTDHLFDGLTFIHERNLDGAFAVHAYPISDKVSTFIVEADESAWRSAGLDEFDVTQAAGPSDLVSKDYLEKLFADQIDGHQLLTNNSRWGNFRTRRTRRWHTLSPRPVVLLGDAAHTAHFSVGSGTKMAMEDAIALSRALTEHSDDLPAALDAYEAAAQPSVRKIQDSARPSLSWWEHFGQYYEALEPWQFAYHFLSRSITDARLARRAPDFVASTHRNWMDEHGAPPLHTPFSFGHWKTRGRFVSVQHVDDVPMWITGTDGERSLNSASVALVTAPDSETELPRLYDDLSRLQGTQLVAVHGGTPLTRVLVSEHATMVRKIPALLIDPAMNRDQALTIVLSGRADLVGGAV